MESDSRETRMLKYYRDKGMNVDGLEKLINKFDCVITNVKQMESKTITIDEMIEEVEKELKSRKEEYSKEVQSGRMMKEYARYHYDCMAAIFENLKGQRDENTQDKNS